MEKFRATCQVRGVCGKGVDGSRPAVKCKNPVDKLTSTVGLPTAFSKYCYYCDKKNDGLIRRYDHVTRQVEKQGMF